MGGTHQALLRPQVLLRPRIQARHRMAPLTPFCRNATIDLTIRQALDCLSEADARAFRRKFREQRHDDQQFMHTFRELLAEVFVARQGFEPHYEPELDGLTPDWRFDATDRPAFLGDVV